MKQSVCIKEVAVYHPSNKVGNDFFVKHFEKQGKPISKMLEAFGRENRYISNDAKENSLTMAIEAALKVLDEAGLKGSDMDLVVFCSGTPEFVAPSNAIKVHHAIEGKSTASVYDMNANCVGMVLALEQVSKYMLSDRFAKRALIVGAEQMNRYSQTTNEITYPNFGDGACAMILEKEEREAGFADSFIYTDSSRHHIMGLPACGFSNMYDPHIPLEDKQIYWSTENDGENGFLLAKQSIEMLLQRNQLSKKDIKCYFLSQLSKKNIERVRTELGESAEKFIFVGNEFGYTGTSSPFIALHHAMENKKIDRGDWIMFWSVGVGFISCCVLMKF